MSDWYEVVQGSGLEQGDILESVALLRPVVGAEEDDESFIAADLITTSAIILTQTCDIVQDKVDELLLAQVVSWDSYVAAEVARKNEAVNSRKFRDKLVEGTIPNLCLLHVRETSPILNWSIVNFRRLFTTPIVAALAPTALLEPRLRLISPYKESVAQAFARYIMRVGLPLPADEFRSYTGRTT